MKEREEICDLPKGWRWVKLDDISLPIEKVNKQYENQKEEFKYIDIESIDNRSQNIKSSKDYTWENAPSRAQQKIQANDILFATVRPYLKNIAVVTPEYDGQIASSGFCVIRTRHVSYKYIYYYISSDFFVKSVNQLAKGTSYPAITNSIVLEQQIPLPPLEEQYRIVERIEEIFSGLDFASLKLNELLLKLNTYKQSFFKSIFDGPIIFNKKEFALLKDISLIAGGV